jgi:hypothetical protein
MHELDFRSIPGTDFTVDAFRFPRPNVKAYFLTHAHGGKKLLPDTPSLWQQLHISSARARAPSIPSWVQHSECQWH